MFEEKKTKFSAINRYIFKENKHSIHIIVFLQKKVKNCEWAFVKLLKINYEPNFITKVKHFCYF